MNLHVLIVTGSGICLIGGDVDFSAQADGIVLVANSVTGTDLRTLGVKGNGQRTAGLDTCGFTSIVDD